MGQTSQPNNNVDLAGEQKRYLAEQALQQAQWQASNNANNQMNTVANQTAQTANDQTTQANQQQQLQYDLQNQTQGAAQNATGGPAGIKAANTAALGYGGLSPADLKLQAAGLAAAPTSLASLMQKRAASSMNVVPTGSNTLANSTNVKLGG